MTGTALTVLVLAFVVAALDWFAVVRSIRPLEYVCKPLTAVLFLLCAIALEPIDGSARAWMIAALVFCVAGDVFLMLPRDAFVPGLASFAGAQILFTVSFAMSGLTSWRLVVGVAVVLAGSGLLARRFIGALHRAGESALVVPIVIYMTVISAMVVSAIAAGAHVAILGAVLFLTSDALIAEHRFVRQRRWQPVTIIVTYHMALAGLVVGLV